MGELAGKYEAKAESNSAAGKRATPKSDKNRLKMPSKMECLNLIPFCYENQAQDAPKTPQDARGGPERRFKDPQDTPRTPQDAPKTPPKRPQDVPKTPQRQGPGSQDAPRRPQAAPRHPQG